MKANSTVYTIQQVSAQCGVSKSTLRFWEKKFHAYMFPDRSKGGQRRYSEQHVELITRIRNLQAEGLSLDDILRRMEGSIPDQPLASGSAKLDRLAERISILVRQEVYRFLQDEPFQNLSGH